MGFSSILGFGLVMVLFFYLIKYARLIDSFFESRAQVVKDRSALELEAERLALAKKHIEIESAKLKDEQLRIENNINRSVGEAREKLEVDTKAFELEKKRLAAPYTAEIEAKERLVKLAERQAQVEIDKAAALANCDVDRIMAERLADFDAYAQAQADRILAQNDILREKSAQNKKYVYEFMRQEDYNGKRDPSYRIKTPDVPHKDI